MTGVEPPTSGIGSDRSTNWATTTAQSYKQFMIVTYDSRVIPDWIIPHITTLES